MGGRRGEYLEEASGHITGSVSLTTPPVRFSSALLRYSSQSRLTSYPHLAFLTQLTPPLSRLRWQPLPENLKSLFRLVSMSCADRQTIIKVRLFAAGYNNYNSLASEPSAHHTSRCTHLGSKSTLADDGPLTLPHKI